VVLAVSGCGFQLRGFGQGSHIGSVQIVAARTVSFTDTVTQQLRQSGVDVVDEGERARFVLEILSQQEDRRTLSVTELARTAEYELLIDVTYRALDAKGELPDRGVRAPDLSRRPRQPPGIEPGGSAPARRDPGGSVDADDPRPRRRGTVGALMPIQVEALERSLESGLKPVYLVAGDETLLVEESCDAIIAAARRAGFSEREVIQADTAFEWHILAQAASSLSLFAERRIIDLRLPVKKLDKEAGEAIAEFGARAGRDTLLLVHADSSTTQARSGLALRTTEGVVVLVVDQGRRLPGWWARCRKAGIKLSRDALAFLADSIEGNLLAAAQEIEKLRLLDLEQPISLETLRAAVQDASHYDTFDLLDAELAADPARVRHIVYVLREQGVDALAVLGLFGYGIRRLVTNPPGGAPPQRANGSKRQPPSAERHGSRSADRAQRIVDRQVKGVPWATPGRPSACGRLRGCRGRAVARPWLRPAPADRISRRAWTPRGRLDDAGGRRRGEARDRAVVGAERDQPVVVARFAHRDVDRDEVTEHHAVVFDIEQAVDQRSPPDAQILWQVTPAPLHRLAQPACGSARSSVGDGISATRGSIATSTPQRCTSGTAVSRTPVGFE
jgi:DNA polymerase-3 subunit delta